jgi:hypothetical protein
VGAKTPLLEATGGIMDEKPQEPARHTGPPLEVVLDRRTMCAIAERPRTPDHAVISRGRQSTEGGDASIPLHEKPSHPVMGVGAGSAMTLFFMLALAVLPIFAISVFAAVPILLALVVVSAVWSMTKHGPER